MNEMFEEVNGIYLVCIWVLGPLILPFSFVLYKHYFWSTIEWVVVLDEWQGFFILFYLHFFIMKI